MEKFEKNIDKEEDVHRIHIPRRELKIEMMRASGPGGQFVNKTSSARRIRWNMEANLDLTEEDKEKIRQAYPSQVTKRGEFLVKCQETRSGAQNEAIAIERLHELVARALKPEKKRVPTKMPKRAKEVRLKEKKIRAEKKRLRKKPIYHE